MSTIGTPSTRARATRDAAAFRVSHERFWNDYIDDLRRRIGPDFAIDDDTLVVLQRFKVVERLDPAEPGVTRSPAISAGRSTAVGTFV